jgi:hypothetical protein
VAWAEVELVELLALALEESYRKTFPEQQKEEFNLWYHW